jgi:hypothetical protein
VSKYSRNSGEGANVEEKHCSCLNTNHGMSSCIHPNPCILQPREWCSTIYDPHRDAAMTTGWWTTIDWNLTHKHLINAGEQSSNARTSTHERPDSSAYSYRHFYSFLRNAPDRKTDAWYESWSIICLGRSCSLFCWPESVLTLQFNARRVKELQ